MKSLVAIFLAILSCYCPQIAAASDTATQTITFQVNAINEISVSGEHAPLVIAHAVAGQEPMPAIDSSSSLSFSTNQASRRITARLNNALAAGAELKIELGPLGPGWASAGEQALSLSEVTVASGDQGHANNVALTYKFSAPASAGLIPQRSQGVTFSMSAQ